MSDTISAAKGWVAGDVRMNFLTPSDVAPPPDMGNFHVTGGAYNTYVSPSLIVQFTTATPDIPGWAMDVTPPSPAPQSISGYAANFTDVTRPVIVGAFNTN